MILEGTAVFNLGRQLSVRHSAHDRELKQNVALSLRV